MGVIHINNLIQYECLKVKCNNEDVIILSLLGWMVDYLNTLYQCRGYLEPNSMTGGKVLST
jgi:hypothetical protein